MSTEAYPTNVKRRRKIRAVEAPKPKLKCRIFGHRFNVGQVKHLHIYQCDECHCEVPWGKAKLRERFSVWLRSLLGE